MSLLREPVQVLVVSPHIYCCDKTGKLNVLERFARLESRQRRIRVSVGAFGRGGEDSPTANVAMSVTMSTSGHVLACVAPCHVHIMPKTERSPYSIIFTHSFL